MPLVINKIVKWGVYYSCSFKVSVVLYTFNANNCIAKRQLLVSKK